METEIKPPLKRPLSFSDDSFEWDSVRDDRPEGAWKTLKVDCDENAMVVPNGLPVDWAPYGCERSRKSKKARVEAGFLTNKKSSTFTVAALETYARLVPFPTDGTCTRMGPNEDWQLDRLDCKLESLLAKPPSNKKHGISFPPWKDAKRRERKHEVQIILFTRITNVKRESKLEDLNIEDGTFSWTTFANLVKPKFAAMEPSSRYEAAKKFSDILKGDLSAISGTPNQE
ncbi:unnamed protein product [Haemonchus placei]|uniref:Uncharacterized protein n=1 Tax=Haemonchus placei TaxID=6290 RepID=A0A0N4WIV7_HAEPC|nr:unnamed protein product [Haemonchus placei]